MCDVVEVHEDAVSRARASMPPVAETENLADFFKVFGDRTRVRILSALDSGEMCVCDISEVLGMSMSAVSHQLRMLRDAHLVSYRKAGKCAYYSLCDEHVRIILESALEHVNEPKLRNSYASERIDGFLCTLSSRYEFRSIPNPFYR